MSGDPLTAAWAEVRAEAAALADDLREAGWTTTRAEADHLAVVDDDPPRLSFTVPDGDADAVADAVAAGEFPTTAVHYADAAGHRLFVLVARDPERATAVVIAGGTERAELERLRPGDAADDGADGGTDAGGTDSGPRGDAPGPADGPAVETVVRRVDGTVAARFAHDDAAPFLAGL